MTPQALAQMASDLERAADLVDAIGNIDLQRRRGWDLDGWCFDLVPWGVRFIRYDADSRRLAEIVVRVG